MEETAGQLPEDVVREILLRLEDTAALLRCAVTCRPWSLLVADASFLRRRWPDQDAPSTLAGFFTWERLLHMDRRPTFETAFFPTPRSFCTGHRSLGSLFPHAGRLLDTAVPLASRRGLLLVRLALRRAAGDPHKSVLRLAVCNLVNGACHVLPPLTDNLDFGKSGYTILASADCSGQQQLSRPSQGYSTFFKVLIVGFNIFDRPRSLHTFSSSEARWSAPRKLLSDTADIPWVDQTPRGSIRHPDGVVCGGTAHWLVGDWSNTHSNLYSLGVDMDTCRLSWTMIPNPTNYCCSLTYDEPQLRVDADRTLSVLFLQRPGLRLQIFTWQDEKKSEDGAVAGWICTSVVELKPPERVIRRRMDFSILGEKGGMVLLKDMDSRRHVYTLDLKTGAMEEMKGWFGELSRQKIVSLEMDWPAFFVSRLGSR